MTCFDTISSPIFPTLPYSSCLQVTNLIKSKGLSFLLPKIVSDPLVHKKNQWQAQSLIKRSLSFSCSAASVTSDGFPSQNLKVTSGWFDIHCKHPRHIKPTSSHLSLEESQFLGRWMKGAQPLCHEPGRNETSASCHIFSPTSDEWEQHSEKLGNKNTAFRHTTSYCRARFLLQVLDECILLVLVLHCNRLDAFNLMLHWIA